MLHKYLSQIFWYAITDNHSLIIFEIITGFRGYKCLFNHNLIPELHDFCAICTYLPISKIQGFSCIFIFLFIFNIRKQDEYKFKIWVASYCILLHSKSILKWKREKSNIFSSTLVFFLWTLAFSVRLMQLIYDVSMSCLLQPKIRWSISSLKSMMYPCHAC